MRQLFAAFVSACLLVGCGTSEEPATGAAPSPDTSARPVMTADETPTPEDSILSGIGTVEYINLEGGFYGIVDEDTGERYDPQSLPDSLQIDGLRVSYRARPVEVLTIHMWGTPVELLSVEQVE
jgi:hypothetical protein